MIQHGGKNPIEAETVWYEQKLCQGVWNKLKFKGKITPLKTKTFTNAFAKIVPANLAAPSLALWQCNVTNHTLIRCNFSVSPGNVFGHISNVSLPFTNLGEVNTVKQ